MKAVGAALTSRYAGWAAVLLAGLAACQGVELGVGVKPAVPQPGTAGLAAIPEASIDESTRLAERALHANWMS